MKRKSVITDFFTKEEGRKPERKRKSSEREFREEERRVILMRTQPHPDYKRPYFQVDQLLFADRESALRWCQQNFTDTLCESYGGDDLDSLPSEADILEDFRENTFADGYMDHAPLTYTIFPLAQPLASTADSIRGVPLYSEKVDQSLMVATAYPEIRNWVEAQDQISQDKFEEILLPLIEKAVSICWDYYNYLQMS